CVLVLVAAAMLLAIPPAFADTSPLLEILSEELNRNFTALKAGDPAPYFMAYSVVDLDATVISAAFGAVQSRDRNRSRILDVTVRVGTPKFDNYHVIRGERARFTSPSLIAVEDNRAAIQRRLWLETDQTYRLASQRLSNLRTSRELSVASEDTSDDFSAEQPIVDIQPVSRRAIPIEQWAAKARKWSAELGRHSGVLTSSVVIMFQQETKHLVTTEGTRLRHGRGFARIVLTAQGKAPDGMDLATTASFEAEDPSGLAGDAEVLAAVRRVGTDLKALIDAPVVDPFVGPAILSGRASGVFFHEIFGHRIEGHRQKDESEGQTFTKSPGSQVLPDFLSVVFDATRRKLGGVDLYGQYSYDDEGVRARPVTVVDKGVLRTFLMSRSPVKSFPRSNGHGRRQPGAEVVSRQSNLIVESSRQVPEARLRELLIAEIKRQNKPYGFYFRDITGGFTTTQRRGVQAFTVIPLVVYRVYPDGRPDELVRGVDIVGTPLASFARIMATSDKAEVFNGYCGAESGNIPVSAVSPAMLVSEIEIQKKDRARDNPPLLPPPPTMPARSSE
ncbi:MAG TPA: metallopeptidase TldD-related protein, partial [Bryobacteraceae bacterium]|nr:metallopeptidase TldD-related protein [Bryobacteraceae bacterium]